MRERLVAALVGLTLVVLALYGIPRAYFLADLVRSQEHIRVERTATLVGDVIDERDRSAVDTALLDRLADDDESIVVKPASGEEVRSTYQVGSSAGTISATVALRRGGTVTVSRGGASVHDEIGRALLPLVLLGLVLAVLAGVAGLFLADRVSRPFQTLASAARGLGAGELHPDLPDYRVPEARAIAAALTTSGQRLDDLLQHQRELVAHASHELRTPVTALRLSLEDLARWDETSSPVAAELERAVGELDRLSAVIGELLATSRDLSAKAEVPVDLDALVAHTASKRNATAVRSGRLATRIDPAPVVEALELLLRDRSRVTTADRGTHLEVAITPYDDGAVDRAADAITAAGGHLARTEDGVLLRVPKRPADTT